MEVEVVSLSPGSGIRTRVISLRLGSAVQVQRERAQRSGQMRLRMLRGSITVPGLPSLLASRFWYDGSSTSKQALYLNNYFKRSKW